MCIRDRSCFAIPIGTAAVDCLLDVFAPLVPEEFARVLKPGGTMILAVPSAKHLWGLKEILYDKPYQNEEKMTEYAGFSFVKRVLVRDRLVLESTEMIQNLLDVYKRQLCSCSIPLRLPLK